ncbi:MAG: hypothetical protein Q9207_000799 [Kuettlingeria erythrocarpa]
MTPLIIRLAHRVRLACDEWIERAEDAQTGHRDKYGRRTYLWHEREYEIGRRRKQRQARRQEKGRIEGKTEGNDEKEGKGDRMKKEKKTVEFVMSGAIDQEEGERSVVEGGEVEQGGERGREGDERAGGEEVRGRSTTGRRGSDGDEEAAVSGEGPIVAAAKGGEGAAAEEAAEGTARSESISPLPSEHSASSIQAQVHSPKTEGKVSSSARGRHDLPDDSEDEKAEDSSDDDDASDEEEDGATEAAKAAKKSEGPTDEGGATSSLRGGGGAWITELDDADDDEEIWYSFGEEVEDKEYNGHEDFEAEYNTVIARQMDIKLLNHVAGDAGPDLGIRAGLTVDPEQEQYTRMHDVLKDDGILWKEHPGPVLIPDEVVQEEAEPKHEDYQEINTKYDTEGNVQSFSHLGDSAPNPANLSGFRLTLGQDVPIQLNGEPGARKSRPYGLTGVGEKTEIHRIGPGRSMYGNRYDYVAAEIGAGPSEQSRSRATGTIKPTAKGRISSSPRRVRSTRANANTGPASQSAQAVSGEKRGRPEPAAAESKRPGSISGTGFMTEDAWYNEQLFGQGKPRKTAHPSRKQGAGRHEETSHTNESARNTTNGANEFRRRGQGGPTMRAAHTHEESVADESFAEGHFECPMPQTGRIYRGGHYQSFDSWNDGILCGPLYGGPHTPRFGGGEPSHAPQGAARTTGGQSYAGERPSKGRGTARGMEVQPDSSDVDDSSSEGSVEPSPLPRHCRTKGTDGRPTGQGRRPPAYQEVDSSKTAPLNHYAVLGMDVQATAKEYVLHWL